MLRFRYASLYVALFLSGGAALVYQTTWGRMLHVVFGVGDLAIATVLAAFFLGLGLGAGLGGRFAGRLRRPALTYAVLEVCVGLYALLSLLVIPNLHSVYASVVAGASFGVLTTWRLVLALLVLVPPTVLMGATLPVLVKVVARAGGDWSSSATALYATNTLGAMAGAGLTGLWLLPEVGTRVCVIIAAAASVLAAAWVFALWRRADTTQEDPATTAPSSEAAPSPGDRESALAAMGRPHLAAALGAIAGFSALAGEVLWTRVLRTIVQGTTPAFAAMLVVYLLGIAAGSVLADRVARRARSALRLFGYTQVALAALTAFAMTLAPQLVRVMGLVQDEPTLEPHENSVVLLLAFLLLGPIALVLGTSIPLAWRIAGGPSSTAPAHAGRVLAYNTLGGLAGALCTGFFLVPLIGMEASLVLVALVHAICAAIALWGASPTRPARRMLAVALPAAVLALIFTARPELDIPYLLQARNDATRAIIEGPGEQWREPVAFLREGRNTTVSLERSEDMIRLFNDGRPESGFGGDEPGFGGELALLGALPTLFADNHDRALVIGLGAGHTTSVLVGGDWARIDVAELEEAVVEAARIMHEAREKPFPLDDPRVHLIVDDARAQIALAEPGTYDAIVSQPSHPWLAGSSALYTHEFFEDVKRALTPGGVLAQWVNLFRSDLPHVQSVVATLLDVFPYAHGFVVEDSSLILVASTHPIPLGARVASRIGAAGLRPYLGPHDLDVLLELAAVRELGPAAMAPFAASAPLIVDDRPSFEFALAALPVNTLVQTQDLDEALPDVPWVSPEEYANWPEDDRVPIVLARLQDVIARPTAIARVELALDAIELEPDARAYIEGAVAEARGNVRLALERYDAAGLPEAALAADSLRHAERMHHQLIAQASARSTVPTSARPYLASTLALWRKDYARQALAIAAQADDPGDAPLADLVRAWTDNDCEGVLTSPALDAEARREEHVAFLGTRCALHTGDLPSARDFMELYTRARRVYAITTAQDGLEAAGGDNDGAAIMLLSRALMANPAHGMAAGGLARLHHAAGRVAEAERVLRAALDASEGLPASTRVVLNAATSLGIELGAHSETPTSASSPGPGAPPQDGNPPETGADP